MVGLKTVEVVTDLRGVSDLTQLHRHEQEEHPVPHSHPLPDPEMEVTEIILTKIYNFLSTVESQSRFFCQGLDFQIQINSNRKDLAKGSETFGSQSFSLEILKIHRLVLNLTNAVLSKTTFGSIFESSQDGVLCAKEIHRLGPNPKARVLI